MTPNQIRALLQLKGTKQVDIAHQAGVHRALVSQVINGYNGSRKSTKAKTEEIKKIIAAEFGIDQQEIFNGQETDLSKLFFDSADSA